MKAYWLTKNIETEIKDVDDTKGIVSGYFSKFGNIDSDGDVIKSGAFLKTIHENMSRIKHLKNHDPNRMIGKIMELTEDGYGLFFTSQMSKNDHGKNALIEYQEELITEHSIGFNIMESDNTSGEYNLLTELKLYEGSAVTWGANPDTPVVGIKGIETREEIEKELNHLLKYCKVNGFTDEVYASAEIKIKQIQQMISNIKKVPPKSDELESSAEAEAKEKERNEINRLIKTFS